MSHIDCFCVFSVLSVLVFHADVNDDCRIGTCASPSWRPCINALIRSPGESKGTSTDSNWSKTKSYWQIFTNFDNRIQTYTNAMDDATQTHIFGQDHQDLRRFAQRRQVSRLLLLSSALHLDGAWHTTHSVLQCNGNDVLIVLFYCF